MHPANDHPGLSRRAFLAAGAGGSLLLGQTAAEEKVNLPTRLLGRTGVRVPILGLGTAPAGRRGEKEAAAFFNHCLDRGMTYLDTAPDFTGYGAAQKALGRVLKERRKDVFLITKVFEPDGEKALQLLKKNLAELQVEQADLVYAHSLGDDRMTPEKIYGKGGLCKALERAKQDGLTRFLGVSGHNRPSRFLRALEEWDFDVMMNAVSLVSRYIYNFEEKVWPKAAKKGVALVAMKVFGGIGPGKKAPKGSRLPAEMRPAAIRYALGLPNLSVMVLGIHDEEELRQNLARVRDSRPLTARELADLDGPSRKLAEQWGNVYGAVV